MCCSSAWMPSAFASCARWRAIWFRAAIARWRCSTSCWTRRRRHERCFLFRALRHRRGRPERLSRALQEGPRADRDVVAWLAALGDTHAGRLERPVCAGPGQGGADGTARIRGRGGDEQSFCVARACGGERGFQALHDLRGDGDPPGDGAGRGVPRPLGRRERGGCLMKPKQHLEFVKVDLSSGWERPPGYPRGFYQKILASDLDEQGKRGSRTRLLKIEAGAFSTEPFVHDHWEEVYLVQGDLVVGNDDAGKGGEQCFAPTYACRPPGVHHGPFTSKGGCILHEIHYYETSGHVKDRR